MFTLFVLMAALSPVDGSVLFASLGENVSLPCYFGSGAKYMAWYKQVAGDEPQVVSSLYVFSDNSYNHQKKTDVVKRMTPHVGENFFHLNISKVQISDTAMYYCGHSALNIVSFDTRIFLLVKESSRLAVIQHPPSIGVSPGGSAAMNCVMHPGSSEGGSVYWFWKASSTSHLGMLYIQSESSAGCVETSKTGCIFMLSKRDVAPADAGTYYCAVASCGEIVFGNGTELAIRDDNPQFYTMMAQCLLVAFLASVIVNVFLAVFLCKKCRRKKLTHIAEIPEGNTPEVNPDDESGDALPYVALDFKKRQGNSRRQRDTEDSIYSGVRLKYAD
ncbi:uncharacterized protein LOC144213946 [Stigmatopora nigra]